MMPNMNKKQMEKMMQQMGVDQEEVPADKVIIRKGSEEIVITDPDVAKVEMMGQETWQITGGEAQARQVSDAINVEISQDDIDTVAEQTGVSQDKAEQALEEHDGDLADAVMALKA